MDDTELRALLAAQAAQISALVAALQPSQPTVTFGELYQKYETAQKHRTSWATISFALRRPLKAFGSRVAMALRPTDWTEHRASIKGLSERTLNQDLTWLRAVLNWSVREGLIPSNPLVSSRRVKIDKKHRETAPPESDVLAMLDVCTRPIERVLVLAWADSGLRNGESRRLEWSWLDRARMEIRLPNAVCKNKRGGPVPMTQRLLDAIDAMPRRLGSPYILPNPRGEPYTTVTVCAWSRALVKRAGLQPAPGDKRVRPHDFRHGYGTNAAERGVRIEVIQKVLRHSSLQQTSDYVQSRSDDLARARELFEAGIKRGR